jgi:type I restriction enzyme S subunit
LLERIRAERKKLINEGKLKRSKGDSAVIRSGDNPYYRQLPDGWATATVESLFLVVGGGTPSTNKIEYWGNGIPWFSSADINENGVITPRRCVTQLGLENSTTNVVSKGNVVVATRVGLGKVAITDGDMCFSQDNQALIPQYSKVIYSRYLFHFLFHEMKTLKLSGRGTTILGITKKQLSDICLWIPPFAEQHRIVAAVETIFEQLDNIAAALM